MRIVLITEDEPFFGPECMSLLLNLLPGQVRPILAVLVQFSPAGARSGRWKTISYLLGAFGMRCLLEALVQYARLVASRAGRWDSVARRLRQASVDLIGPVSNVNDEATLAAIRQASPDLLLSFSINSIFGSRLLAIAPCMNLHLSLLPRHRGLMPVFWALHDGDTTTGITVYWVDNKASIDGGATILQRSLAIETRRLVPLYGALKRIGMHALAEAVTRHLGEASHGHGQIGKTVAAGFRKLPDRHDVERFRRRGNREF